MGYVDVLFAGNALAAHDIEYNLMGTSLGMDLTTGKPVIGGHCHHLQAISEVIRPDPSGKPWRRASSPGGSCSSA